MRLPARIAIAVGLLAAATPCMAVTVVPPPQGSDAPVSRFSDPDEAVANSASQVRDSVVENNLRAQGGAAFTGGSAVPYGYSGQSSNFGPATAVTQTYSGGSASAYGPAAYGPPVVLPFGDRRH